MLCCAVCACGKSGARTVLYTLALQRVLLGVRCTAVLYMLALQRVSLALAYDQHRAEPCSALGEHLQVSTMLRSKEGRNQLCLIAALILGVMVVTTLVFLLP